MAITEQDFKNWWKEPVGRRIKQMIEGRISMIDRNSFLTEVDIVNQIGTAVQLGRKQQLHALLDLTFKDMEEEIELQEVDKERDMD